MPVVDLENGSAARLQDPVTLPDQTFRLGGVLHDAVSEDHVETIVLERERLPVRNLKAAGEPLLREVGGGETDRRSRDIHADDRGSALGKSRQVDAGAASDFEHRPAGVAVEVDEPQQVMKLFEVILLEVVEECSGADRVCRDVEI